MQREGYQSAGGAARLVMAVALAALAGGCHDIGNAYDTTVETAQSAYQGAYRSAYDSVHTTLFGAPQPAPPPVPVRLPPPAPTPVTADRIVVFKTRHLLELVHRGEVFESFPIALGPDADGPKRQKGDGRTPEGRYTIDRESTDTKYTGELHISYPDAADRARAAAMGVDPGGAIFIHGMPLDYGPYDPPQWFRDWTEGCIAVGNIAIEKIMSAVPVGTPIDILP